MKSTKRNREIKPNTKLAKYTILAGKRKAQGSILPYSPAPGIASVFNKGSVIDGIMEQIMTEPEIDRSIETFVPKPGLQLPEGPSRMSQFLNNLVQGIKGKVTGMSPAQIGVMGSKLGGLGLEKFSKNEGMPTTGQDATYSGTQQISDLLQLDFKSALHGTKNAKKERGKFWDEMGMNLEASNAEQSILDSANVGLGSTATSRAYRSNIGNMQFAQGGYNALGSLQGFGNRFKNYRQGVTDGFNDLQNFGFSDVKDMVQPLQPLLPTGEELRGYLHAQGGSAKNVDGLGHSPAGTTVNLTNGGKAVSRGNGVHEYVAKPHEQGGADITGSDGEPINIEGGEVQGPVTTSDGETVQYILSDYPGYKNSDGKTPAQMVKDGGNIQDAVKFNEHMASIKGTPYGGPADPSRNPQKFAQAGIYSTEDDQMKYKGSGKFIDYAGDIGKSSWRNVYNSDWGKRYGVTEATTQEELKGIYATNYKTDIEEFYNNKDVALSTLKTFSESDNPNAENFRKVFKGLDFEKDSAEILRRARAKSLDGKIGSFHMFGAAAEAEAEAAAKTAAETGTEAETAAGADKTAEEIITPAIVDARTKQEAVEGLGYKNEMAVPPIAGLGMAAGLLPAFAPKIQPAELISATPGIRAPKLPRVNLQQEDAAAASDFAATLAALERMGSVGSGMYNSLLANKGKTNNAISAQELSANKELATSEALTGVKAAQVNKASEDSRNTYNTAAKNAREDFRQEQVRADLDNISKNIQQSSKDILSFKAEKDLADAIDVYDTRGFDRTYKSYQKKRDRANSSMDTKSPFYNKTDEELRQHASGEINSRTGFDPTDIPKSLEEIMKSLEEMKKSPEPEPKQSGGSKKYLGKISNVKRY